VPWSTLILSFVLYIVVPVIVAQLWRRATAVGVAVHALNRMLALGRPNYIRIS
jgi:arsenite transporter